MNRHEVIAAIEKARAKANKRQRESDPENPAAVLVYELYGANLYAKLPKKVRTYFDSIAVAVIASAVIGMDGILNSFDSALETSTTKCEAFLKTITGMDFDKDQLAELFDPSFESRPCDCGKPDARHSIMEALYVVETNSQVELDAFLLDAEIKLVDYDRVKELCGII